jgi:Domain of unknown function (DUF4397)
VDLQQITDKTVPKLLSLVFLLCGGASGGSESNPSAMLRVVNGMWGSAGVNVVVDGATVATSIPYSTCVTGICTALSGYVTVKSGGVNFVVVEPPGQTNLVPSQFQKLNLEPNTKNTFVVGPTDTATNGGGGFLFSDDDIPASNMVKLRVADVSPNTTAPAWIVPTGTTVGSASSYMTLPPNTYDIYLAGINCGFDSNCSVVTATLNANQNVTVYLLWEGLASRPVILADD